MKNLIRSLLSIDPDIQIVTLGNTSGVDSVVRKICLEIDSIKYGEFNPGYTPRTLYSLMPPSNYNQFKSQKIWEYRNRAAAKYVEYTMVFITKNTDLDEPVLAHFIQCLDNEHKQYVIYNTTL